MLFEFALEPREQREAVRGGAGESGQHVVMIETTDLPRLMFHDGLTQRHLAIAGQNDLALMANREDGGGVHGGDFSS